MSKKDLRLLLIWRMCSDPFPLHKDDMTRIDAFLNFHSLKKGFRNWVDAYHKI